MLTEPASAGARLVLPRPPIAAGVAVVPAVALFAGAVASVAAVVALRASGDDSYLTDPVAAIALAGSAAAIALLSARTRARGRKGLARTLAALGAAVLAYLA